MKRIFATMMVALAIVATTQAQTLQQGEQAIVYYSPRTHVVLDFSYAVETEQVGIYASYAEKLLGIKDAVTENKTTYTLTGVNVHTRTDADHARPHKVVAEAGVPMQLLRMHLTSKYSYQVGYGIPHGLHVCTPPKFMC